MWFRKKNQLDKLMQEAEKSFLQSIEKVLRKLLNDTEAVPSLKEAIQKLKDELADLRTTKKQEQRDIEHLVKCKEKKMALETKEKELELQKKFNGKEMELQTKFHKDSLEILDTARKEMKEVYEKIMERLPNVNAQLNIGRKPK